MKRICCTLLIVISLPLFAGTKTCVREYTYKAGEADSKITSRAIALDQVKRILLEEIGVYLQSEMTTTKEEKNNVYNELTKQQIQSVTAGITETKIVEEKWNGEIYYIKASITVDPDEVNKNIARIGADKSRLKELEDVQRKADEAFAEIEQLRKELAVTKSEKEKSAKQKEYVVASNTLSATDWFQKGSNACEVKDYDNAILFYGKTIELNPNDAIVYNNRGFAKHKLGHHKGAIADYNKAIGLNPDDAIVYNNRGIAKEDINDPQGAIADYTKAIKLKPGYADAYFDRGYIKYHRLDYQGAIADLTKAIKLKPDDAYAYCIRGNAKNTVKVNDWQGALADFTIAIKLKPEDTDAYSSRGFIKYFNLKDYQGAIADLTKAIDLDPDDVEAYRNRGNAYLMLNQKSKALADFKRVIELGYSVFQMDLDACK